MPRMLNQNAAQDQAGPLDLWKGRRLDYDNAIWTLSLRDGRCWKRLHISTYPEGAPVSLDGQHLGLIRGGDKITIADVSARFWLDDFDIQSSVRFPQVLQVFDVLVKLHCSPPLSEFV
jgi:hypothetical protein